MYSHKRNISLVVVFISFKKKMAHGHFMASTEAQIQTTDQYVLIKLKVAICFVNLKKKKYWHINWKDPCDEAHYIKKYLQHSEVPTCS